MLLTVLLGVPAFAGAQAPAMAHRDSAQADRSLPGVEPGAGWQRSVGVAGGPAGRQLVLHYPQLQYMTVADAPSELRPRVPVFLTGYAALLGDEPGLSPVQQANRILQVEYGCTRHDCGIDFAPYATSYDGLVKGIARAVVLRRVLAASSEPKLRDRLREAASGWDTAERLAFIQQVGRIFVTNYDYGELGPGPKRKLEAFDLVRGYQAGVPTGICGAIANAQAWMLREMGFQDVFVVTGRNIYYNHATVIVRDPSDSRRLIKINGEKITESSLGDEAAALAQSQDESTSYFLYRVDGGLIANVQTELGILLYEKSGGRLDDLDMLARQTAPAVASVDVRKGRFGGNLTTALLSNGTQVVALLSHVDVGDGVGPGLAAELGGGLVLQTGIVNDYTIPGLYTRAALRYNTPWLGGSVRTRSEASIQVSSKLNLFDFRGESLTNRSNVAQRLQVLSRDGRTSGDLRIGGQYLYYFNDPRVYDDFRLVRNYWFVEGDGRRALGRHADALARVLVGFRQRELGPQIDVSLGLRSRQGSGLDIGYRGRTDEERLSLVPGSVRSLYVRVRTDLPGLSLQSQYEHPLEGYSPIWRVWVAWTGAGTVRTDRPAG